MKHLFALILASLIIPGCFGGSAKVTMYGTAPEDKSAALEYTSIGITSDYKFEGIATGTYKSIGYEAGLFYYAGSQNIEITVDAAQHWKAVTESKRQGFEVSGISLKLHNPYVGTVSRDGKTIGYVALDMPSVDKAETALKYVGLDTLVHRNLTLKGEATILDRVYTIESVFNGDETSNPVGYRVLEKGRVLGLIKVGKNMAGGQKLHLWIKPDLDPVTEQSAVTALLICGWAI